MAIVEDITNEDEQIPNGSSSKEELIKTLEKLSAELIVPKELVPGFMTSPDQDALYRYQFTALRVLDQIRDKIQAEEVFWKEVDQETQLRVMQNVLRLYGEEDPWCSPPIRETVQNIVETLSSSIPILILPTLRPYFSSHPHLSSNSRALSRPSGGIIESSIDLHDVQPFKEPSSWGISNLLVYSTERLSNEEVERYIGLILPPTLVLMDDWEPLYRSRGAKILDSWIHKLDYSLMKRMGIDKLLLDSLIHTISLNHNPPLKGILQITLNLIDKCHPKTSKSVNDTTKKGQGENRMKRYGEIIDKGIVQGWIYSPSGLEGRSVLINIASMLEKLCDVLGVGIIRWLKTIIPQLLQPLQYPPTTVVLPHYEANLSCLLCVMKTIRETGRIDRWRGEILNILCRLWVQLKERSGLEDESERNNVSIEHENQVKSLVKQIFHELAEQVSSVKQVEYPRLIKLSPGIFEDLIPKSASEPRSES
ncbi:uncharacterized protein IL334_002723 [Kwoniella shivajii]|uniref:Uncharacterized protein n=1 Tax=Kwoniella shivajii TaxID=564305 RepID=A0ABZ1CWU3_9TREE|nr:hypothetical protein IL334_002723 [Kwoniella shivajii]